MVDREIIEERIGIILKNIQRLRRFLEMDEEKFISDEDLTAAAKYYLQTAIESMIDIGNHIVARKKLGVPQTNIETFEILAENKIISKENLDVYKKMLKFRNMLVHLYHRIDDRKVYEILKTSLHDFEKFIQEINTFLQGSGLDF